MEGWIKLYRKFPEWEWFRNSEMVHLFIYLLLKANSKESRWQGITIHRGQLVTGRQKLSQITGISERSIRTCLERLKSTNAIAIKTTNQYSIITIINYDSYQAKETKNDQQNDQQTDQRPTSNRPRTDQQPTTNKNNKNIKNTEYKEKEKKKFENIPPSLEEIKQRIVERSITSFTAEAFHSFYTSKGWMIGKDKMKNWDSALTTWIIKNKSNGAFKQSDRRNEKRVNDLWN